MQAAKEWGLTPSEWRAHSIDDRARMMAHGWIESTREAYSAEGRLFDAGDQKEGKKGGGMAAFTAMKQRMRPPPGWVAPGA